MLLKKSVWRTNLPSMRKNDSTGVATLNQTCSRRSRKVRLFPAISPYGLFQHNRHLQTNRDQKERSAVVQVFGCRPHDDCATGSGAGVRKPAHRRHLFPRGIPSLDWSNSCPKSADIDAWRTKPSFHRQGCLADLRCPRLRSAHHHSNRSRRNAIEMMQYWT
jgi:hypothetical protein